MTRSGRRWRPGTGCGSGCGTFIAVLVLGGLLSLLGLAFGIGVSLRIPFTESNVSMAGSIGRKEEAVQVLPAYLRTRVGDNQNLVNNTTTMTIGPAEGIGVFVIGAQEGAPIIDLRLALE